MHLTPKVLKVLKLVYLFSNDANKMYKSPYNSDILLHRAIDNPRQK